MTALAGFWSIGGRHEPLARCRRMLDAQARYGPEPPIVASEGDLALGKRPWRILAEDALETAPVVGGGGRWTLVADLRLDNRDELGDELGLSADRLAGLPDAMVAMSAVERWEEQAIGRLEGDFALALWDRERERLLLARDFLGQRPLHFHRAPGFLAFASMPGGLFALPEVPRAADETGILDFLALMLPEGRHSHFRGVERVSPGETCVFTRSAMTSSRHWSFAAGPLRLARPGDYVEAVREALDRAVKARLRGAGGGVAAHLSGGLDSGAVAATAARLLPPGAEVTAFTSVPGGSRPDPRGRFVDEAGHAAAVASLYPNMNHVLVRTGGRSPIGALDRSFDLYQAPVLNLCNFVWGEAIADSARERGHRVLLTGQVGNFTFSHTGLDVLPDLLASGRLIRVAREGSALRRRGTRLESVAAHTLWPFLPPRLFRLVNRLRGRRVGAGAGETSLLNPALGEAAATRLARRLAQATSGREWGIGVRLSALAGAEFGNFHKGALAGWGLDVRDPTGDRRLVELCLSIPGEIYLADGVPRALARRVLADRLPPLVVNETRKGLQGADWHEGLLADWDNVRREVDRIAAAPAAARLLDIARMTALLEAPAVRDWDSNEAHAHYRLALLRGISAGHFIRRADGPD
ncbi:MAG TPA: asparagine synthase-related protein [Allosphingosinicella sp.]|nr:asparagine synthase-related protein [Allosphingosinicella sp.]